MYKTAHLFKERLDLPGFNIDSIFADFMIDNGHAQLVTQPLEAVIF